MKRLERSRWRSRVDRQVGALALAALCAAWPAATAIAQLPSSLVNGSFESGERDAPAGWVVDPQVRAKGRIALVEGVRGAKGRALALSPNATNVGERPLGLGQALDPQRYRGRRLAIDAALGAAAGATAIVGVHAFAKNREVAGIEITQGDSGGELRAQTRTLDVPADAEQLIVFAIVGGTSGTAYFDSIALANGGPAGSARSAPAAASATITIDPSASLRRIPATIFGTNVEWINDGQGLWSASRKGLDPDVVQWARELGPTLIRFPGGVFSDAYHWRDGVGPQERRPTSAQLPNGPHSRHSFGTPEVSEFARAIGAELLLTVNAGSGTAAEAADWVRYMNRDGGMPVRFWEVGNELYMKSDLSGAHPSPTEYARRFVEFAAAMRAVDPGIRVGAIGGLNYGNYRFIADDRWTETLLARAAGAMDFLSVHDAYAPVVMGVKPAVDGRKVYEAMLAAPVLIEANLRDVSRLLERYEKPGRHIAIAVTEWGPLFHVAPDSPWVDHAKTMGSALFVASAMNSMLRTPRVEIANFFKLNEPSFMGWIGRRHGRWITTAPYQVFRLYRHRLGRNLVRASVDGPTYAARALGAIAAVDRVPYLDAIATFDGTTVTLIVTNKSDTQPIDARIALRGVAGTGAVAVEGVYGDGYDANTGTELPEVRGLRWARQADLGEFARGAPERIHALSERVAAATREADGAAITYRFRPLSVTSLTFGEVRR